MSTNTVTSENTVTPAEKEATFLAEREADIRKKHRRVIPGTIRREQDGLHANKLTVEMKCQNKGCEKTRRVATSDLHQVRYCPDCTAELRNRKRRAKASAARKAKEGAEEAKPKVQPKPRKVRKKKDASPSLAASNNHVHEAVLTQDGPAIAQSGDKAESFPQLPTTELVSQTAGSEA